jgi:hypothetical protein
MILTVGVKYTSLVSYTGVPIILWGSNLPGVTANLPNGNADHLEPDG